MGFHRKDDYGEIIFFIESANDGVRLKVHNESGDLKIKPLEYKDEQACIADIRAMLAPPKQVNNFLF